MGRGEYIGQMIDAALEIREIRQASKTKHTFEIANKSDLRFAVRPASYDYPMPVYAGQVLRIDITQGEGSIYELHPRQGQVLHPHILGIGRRGSALRTGAAATDTVFCYRSYI